MKHTLFLFGFFLTFSGLICAQESKKNVHYDDLPFPIFLTELEVLFDVKFSYNSTSFEGIKISIDKDVVSFSDLIETVSNSYPVRFKKVDARYYVVTLNDNVNICGQIMNDKEEPMIGATITNGTKKKGVLSNEKGFFNITKNKPTDTLTISFLGYKTLTIPVRDFFDNQCKTHILKEEGFFLNEVLIKEYLTVGMQKERSGAVKISPSNLKIISGVAEPDVLDNIQLLPGIESPLETASGIYIRGGTPDQNLILWDGIKMYNSDHFFGFISAFNPYIVKDVTIFKSGTASIYGDRISGVIDIKTEDSIPNTIKGGAGLNMTHADVFVKFPISKNTGVLLSGRSSITGIVETPTITEYANRAFQNTGISDNRAIFDSQFSDNNEQFYFTDVTLKVMTSFLEKHKISLSNLFTQNNLDYSFMDRELAVLSSDKLAIKNIGANISWESQWNSDFYTKSQVSFSEYDLEYQGRNNLFALDERVVKTNTIKEVGFLFHAGWKMNSQFELSGGYQLYKDKVDFLIDDSDTISLENSQNSTTHSLYGQLTYGTGTSWLINLGVRSSYYTLLNRNYIEPRFFIERKLGKYFRINGSAEVKNQSISQIVEFATFNFGLENQLWTLAEGDDFPLLRSNQYTLGTLFNRKNWNIEVDSYYKKVNGLSSLTSGFEIIEEVLSDGKSISKGVDVLIKNKIGNYSIWLGYSFSDTDFTFGQINNGSSFKGNNDITHSLSWSHAYQWKKIQFSLGWKYRTGVPFTPVAEFELTNDGLVDIQYESLNSGKLPDYHRLDFSMVYDFSWSKKKDAVKSRLGFSLLNLYQQKNILNRTYVGLLPFDENDTFKLQEIDRISLGITPNVTFRIYF